MCAQTVHACRNIKCLVTLFFPRDFRVKCLVFPQVYTVIAFGASIFLWSFLPTVAIVPSMEGMPRYSIHPLFTSVFFLSLSTAIVWFIVSAISLHNIRKQRMTLAEIVRKNFLSVSLAILTVVVALSGCIVFSEKVPHFEDFQADGLLDLQGLRLPNPFALLYGIGILLCEPAWIITVLSKYLRMRTHKPCYMVP